MMRKSILLSTGFHLAVITAGYIGLPAIRKPPPIIDIPISVEVVEIAAKTQLPAAPEKKVEKPKKAQKKPPPPPPPPPKPEVAAPPPPPPPEPAEVVKVAKKAEPKPKAKPKPKPKPQAKPKPKAKPKPPTRLAKLRPRRKPKPPDPFASVLRTVEKIRHQPQPKKRAEKKKEKKPKPKTSFEELIAKSLRTARVTVDATRVTLSERDALVHAIKRQLEPCWNLPAGAKGAKGMVIGISVKVDPNGRVRSARIRNQARMGNDPFFRASAESALRAVLNPKCSPFKLPADKYAIWRDLNINFDPRDMF